MKKMFKSTMLISFVMLSGCTTILSHSGGEMKASGQRVKASSTKLSFLHLMPMEEKALQNFWIAKDLHAQCPDGKITDVESILWIRHWGIIQTHNIDAMATCTK